MEESSVQARMYFPLGEKDTEVTGALSSWTRVRRHCPVEVSQMRLENMLLEVVGEGGDRIWDV